LIGDKFYELAGGKGCGQMFELNTPASLDSIAHLIQVALTPVFLLSGLAGLLNVFSTRLGRVADRVDQLSEAIKSADPAQSAHMRDRLTYLQRRSLVLDLATILGAMGSVWTCVATLTLFVGALRNSAVANILFLTFGLAILSTLGALVAFVIEMLMASRSLREEAEKISASSLVSASKPLP
jgi:hypothetical protein